MKKRKTPVRNAQPASGDPTTARRRRAGFNPDKPFGDADWLKKPLLVQGDDDEIRREYGWQDLRQE